jgi:hypothetical protein
MKRAWTVAAVAVAFIALFAIGLSASFPIARTVDERAMAALVGRFPPGSSYGAAVEYLTTHYHEVRRPLRMRGSDQYATYAGGVPWYCDSQALFTIRGANGTIHAWFYGYNDRMLCRPLLWLAPNFRMELSGHQVEAWVCESDTAIREVLRQWPKLYEPHMFPC